MFGAVVQPLQASLLPSTQCAVFVFAVLGRVEQLRVADRVYGHLLRVALDAQLQPTGLFFVRAQLLLTGASRRSCCYWRSLQVCFGLFPGRNSSFSVQVHGVHSAHRTLKLQQLRPEILRIAQFGLVHLQSFGFQFGDFAVEVLAARLDDDVVGDLFGAKLGRTVYVG